MLEVLTETTSLSLLVWSVYFDPSSFFSVTNPEFQVLLLRIFGCQHLAIRGKLTFMRNPQTYPTSFPGSI
jgi:hypothetical protein